MSDQRDQRVKELLAQLLDTPARERARVLEPACAGDVELQSEVQSLAHAYEEGSDFFVCNRGNGTVVRMAQNGTLLGARRVRVHGRGLGEARLNGIATSPDDSKIWVTYVGHLPGAGDRQGGVIELPSF